MTVVSSTETSRLVHYRTTLATQSHLERWQNGSCWVVTSESIDNRSSSTCSSSSSSVQQHNNKGSFAPLKVPESAQRHHRNRFVQIRAIGKMEEENGQLCYTNIYIITWLIWFAPFSFNIQYIYHLLYSLCLPSYYFSPTYRSNKKKRFRLFVIQFERRLEESVSTTKLDYTLNSKELQHLLLSLFSTKPKINWIDHQLASLRKK